MNSISPLVSVIMPAYNAEKYIDSAIKSVLLQSFKDFELIIINDGSTDNTEKIAAKYLRADDRVKLHCQENSGIIDSLNFGIGIAQGKYIARMDSDDLCLPSRLDAQVKWMEESGSDVSGGSIQPFVGILRFTKRFYLSDEANQIQLLFNSCFAHPATMIRKELFNEFTYDHADRFVEDYGLWCKFSSAGYKLTNIRKTVLRYRKHASQITSRQADLQAEARKRVAESYREQKFKGLLDQYSHKLLMSRGELLAGDQISDVLESLITLAKQTGDPEKVVSNNAFVFMARHAEFGNQRLRVYLNYFKFNTLQRSILEYLTLFRIDQSTRTFRLLKGII